MRDDEKPPVDVKNILHDLTKVLEDGHLGMDDLSAHIKGRNHPSIGRTAA